MRRAFARLLARIRRVSPAAPPLPRDLGEATFLQLRRYAVFQRRALRRISRDPTRPVAARRAAAERAADIRDVLRAHPLREDLCRCIRETWRQDAELRRPASGC